MKSNPYKILSIDQDASDLVIKAAYRALMKSPEGHPDLGGNEEYTKLLNEAYNTLIDSKKRKEIDKTYRVTTSQKVVEKYFIVCVLCQTINRIDNIGQIHYLNCAKCNESFLKANQAKAEPKETFQSKTQQQQQQQQKQPKQGQITEEFALFLYNKNLYYRALADYQSLLEKKAPNAFLEYMVGMCYYKMHHYNDAIRYFLLAIQTDPMYSIALYFLGRALMNLNQFGEAIRYFEKYTTFEGDEKLSAIALIGCCYYSLAYYKKAIAEFNKVILKDPTLEQSIYYLGLCHYRRKEFFKAKSCFLLSKQLFPKNSKIPELIEHCDRHIRQKNIKK